MVKKHKKMKKHHVAAKKAMKKVDTKKDAKKS
jgi:hypothetical protein